MEEINNVMGFIAFIFLVIHRGLSGLQNHYGYRNQHCSLFVISIILFIFTTKVSIIWVYQQVWISQLVAGILFAISAFSIYGVVNSFNTINPRFPHRDVHFWEVLLTGGFVLGSVAIGVDLIYILLSVPTGMVLHKGFINIANSRPFIDANEITDDKTGKTYGIPSLGIKMLRLVRNGYVRLVIGYTAIELVILNELITKFHFTIFDVINLVN